MNLDELLNLDIRIIAPSCDLCGNEEDLGIIFKRNSGFGMIIISEGWEILKSVRKSHFKNMFGFPFMKPHHFASIKDDIKDRTSTIERIEREEFRCFASTFVEHYVLGRFEEWIESPESYIKLKEGVEDSGGEKDLFFEERKKQVERLERYWRECPRALELRADPTGIYREVRLDNKLSNCLITPQEYQGLSIGVNAANPHLGMPDLVFVYPDEICIVEIKTTYSPNKHIKSLRKAAARRQLTNAGRFFQFNFDVSPRLVRAMVYGKAEEEELRVDHYRLVNNCLQKIDF